jgi:PAS domain S-box-containing protein
LDVWLTTTLLRDEKGSPVAIATTERDITERRQAEAEAKSLSNFPDENPDPVLRLNGQGIILYANHAGQAVLEAWKAAVGQAAPAFLLAKIAKAFETRSRQSIELSVGGRVFSFTIAPILDAGYVNLYGSDITERKQAEEAAQFLASIVDSTDDAIIGKSLDGIILSWNPGAEKLYGYPAPEAVGKPISIIALPEKPDEMQEILGKVSRGEKIEYYETKRLTREGKRIDVSLTVFPVRDREGRIVAASMIGRDITERKQAEEKLRAVVDDLERSNKELEQFAYVASHDLQEPLRMVSSYMQLIAKRYQGKLDSNADEFIAYAVDGAVRMQRMINDLLAFSRLGTRGKPFQPTDTETVLNDVLENLKLAIEENHALVTHDPLPTVMAEESQLAQVFQNLIGNALKFHGEEPPRVHVSARKTSAVWEFSVRDNGIGIDPQFFERIFLIFQRLSTRAEHPGSGIGLAICKKIVERHGGRIWIESKPGQGATFFFTLPAA